MEKSNYTPGPWNPHPFHEAVISASGERVCLLVTQGGNPKPQTKPNAILISAAPDLLEAALWVFNDADDRGETRDEETMELHPDWQALYNAIQKAKGEI